MPKTTNLEQLRPPGHLFELKLLRETSRAAFADGEAFGQRLGWKQGVRWGIACGLCTGFLIGALVRHFAGSLS